MAGEWCDVHACGCVAESLDGVVSERCAGHQQSLTWSHVSQGVAGLRVGALPIELIL